MSRPKTQKIKMKLVSPNDSEQWKIEVAFVAAALELGWEATKLKIHEKKNGVATTWIFTRKDQPRDS